MQMVMEKPPIPSAASLQLKSAPATTYFGSLDRQGRREWGLLKRQFQVRVDHHGSWRVFQIALTGPYSAPFYSAI